MIAVGYVVFAWLDRAPALAAVAAGLIAVTLGLWLTGIEARTIGVAMALIYGASFVITGLAYAAARKTA